MVRIVDRLLLFLFSLTILLSSCVLLVMAWGLIPFQDAAQFVHDVQYEASVGFPFIAVMAIVLVISIRFFYISVRRGKNQDASINQRTEFGTIQISLETIENLALKAAGRSRGVKDLKARVRIQESGLDLMIRALMDGESSIPQVSEEMQNNVKSHIEEITGLPVSGVSVYVANVAQSAPTFRSRVE